MNGVSFALLIRYRKLLGDVFFLERVANLSRLSVLYERGIFPVVNDTFNFFSVLRLISYAFSFSGSCLRRSLAWRVLYEENVVQCSAA